MSSDALDLTTRLLDRCLICDGAKLRDVLNLGEMPLANAFHDGGKRQQKYPLLYRVCQECWHGQLSVAVDPKEMFSNYLYVSGTTRTLKQYFKEFVTLVELNAGVTVYGAIDAVTAMDGYTDPPLKVLEIGSNDGTLLAEFKKRGHTVLGVDPAVSLCEEAFNKRGVLSIAAFWHDEVVKELDKLGKPFDTIIAMNVLAHTADPLTFLKLCKRVLAPGGRIYVQTSQAMMLLNGEFDTIYHEHVSYFTASSFHELAKRAGLGVAKIERVPIHGTSYLVEMTSHVQMPSNASRDVAKDEQRMGYYASVIYYRFETLAKYKKEYAVKTIESCRANGYVIVGYGAAAKGMTFLNYTGIELDAIVDDNPLKVGKFCPDNDTRVVGPEWMPDAGEKVCWLLLAWNFAEEIIERIRNARPNNKDLFVTCFPSAKIQ